MQLHPRSPVHYVTTATAFGALPSRQRRWSYAFSSPTTIPNVQAPWPRAGQQALHTHILVGICRSVRQFCNLRLFISTAPLCTLGSPLVCSCGCHVSSTPNGWSACQPCAAAPDYSIDSALTGEGGRPQYGQVAVSALGSGRTCPATVLAFCPSCQRVARPWSVQRTDVHPLTLPPLAALAFWAVLG